LTRTIVTPRLGTGSKLFPTFHQNCSRFLSDFIQKFGSFKAPKLLVIANWRIGFMPEISVS